MPKTAGTRIKRPSRRVTRAIARNTSAIAGGGRKLTKKLTKQSEAIRRTTKNRAQAGRFTKPGTSPILKKRGRKVKK